MFVNQQNISNKLVLVKLKRDKLRGKLILAIFMSFVLSNISTLKINECFSRDVFSLA